MQEIIERTFRRVFRFNPAVAILELRTRLRGNRAHAVLFAYATIACATLLALLGATSFSPMFRHTTQHANTAIYLLSYIQLGLIFLIIPAYAGGGIALEREKQTLELLRTSRLSAVDVVSGKLVSLVAFAGMMLVATIPVGTWCLMLGGVSPMQLLMIYIHILVVALEIAALGLLISTRADRAITGVVATYIIVFVSRGLFSIVGLQAMTAVRAGSVGATIMLGPRWAIPLVALAVIVVSAIVYLLIKEVALPFLERALPSQARRWQRVGLGDAVAAMAVMVLVAIGFLALPAVTVWPRQVLMLANPSTAVMAMLDTSLLGLLLHAGVGGTSLTSGMMWLLSIGGGLLLAAFFWLLAVASYRSRNRLTRAYPRS